MIGYVPSLVIPALTAFGAVFFYTRLMSPAEYGAYALTVSLMMLLNTVFFYWLQLALPRLLPQAVKENREAGLRATIYVAFAAMSLIFLALAALAVLFVPLGEYKPILWLAAPLTVMRSLLSLNEAVYRSKLDFSRYNLIECGQAALGLALGLGFVWFLRLGNAGAILGMIIGMMAVALLDIKILLQTSPRDFHREALREIMRFGAPLVLAYALSYIIASSDRFFIEYFQGPGAVGVYAAGYSLMDRITSIVFMVVSTASYPLIVHKYEHESLEAAQRQMHNNGVATLALALPVCAGLILTAPQIAAVLIGPAFRDGALLVMPWIAVAAIFNGLATHYFSHSFYLAKKSHMFFYTQGPAALVNLVMNFILIPRFGYIAAAWSTLISYAIAMLATVWLGRGVFPFPFPFKSTLLIVAATALMIAPLVALRFSVDLLGLAEMVALGGLVYGAALMLFDVMQIRSRVFVFVRSRFAP